jgi:hypothetical protein
MVTTNLRPLHGTALKGALGADEFRVLIRQVADGSKPWLLRLNGDISDPDSIVLTTEDFQRPRWKTSAARCRAGLLVITYCRHWLPLSFAPRSPSPECYARQVRPQTATNTAIALTPDDLKRVGCEISTS